MEFADLTLARDAALAASRAYLVGETGVRPGERYTRYPDLESECLAIKVDGKLFLTGPGTASLRDWNTNRKIIARKITNTKPDGRRLPGRWHRGYAAVATRAADWYESQIWQLADDDDMIVFVGHSLFGGVIGVVAGIMIDRGFVDSEKDRLITFGAPRFAGRKAAAYLNDWWRENAQRWVFQSEVVPYLVPAIGMRHVGVLHQIVNNHLDHKHSFRDFWRDLGSAFKQPGFDLVKDHGMANYVAWLNAAIERAKT